MIYSRKDEKNAAMITMKIQIRIWRQSDKNSKDQNIWPSKENQKKTQMTKSLFKSCVP